MRREGRRRAGGDCGRIGRSGRNVDKGTDTVVKSGGLNRAAAATGRC